MNTRLKRIFFASLSVASALTLTACGGGSDDTPPQTLNKDLCFDSSIYAAGSSYKLVFAEAISKGELSVTGSVRSTNASIDGTSNLVEFVETTDSVVNTVVTRYLKPLAPGIIALYHTDAVQGAYIYTATSYAPPYEDRRAALTEGDTGTFVGQGVRTSGAIGSSSSAPYTRQEKIKFVGVERITMPAGTFTACRYETDVATEWWHRSMVVRQDWKSGESRILKSGELNGAPLKNQ